MNDPLTAAERRVLKKIQSKGGKKTFEKYGVEHMKKISALGAAGRKKKKDAKGK